MTTLVKETNNNSAGKVAVNGSKAPPVSNGGKNVADAAGDKMTLVIHKYEAPPGTEKQHVVQTEDLDRYVSAMKESGGFKEQLATLKTGQLKPWTVAQKPENKIKNRYADLLPFSHLPRRKPRSARMTTLVKETNNNSAGKVAVNGSKAPPVSNGGKNVADAAGDKMTLVIHKYEAPPGTEKQHVVQTEDLDRYVSAMKESGGFKEQLATLKTGQLKPWTVAQKPENKIKNRYADLLPYDDTRVILHALKNDPSSDYINANYISGYNKPKAYICTQGPVEKTVADFWRLVWQEEICKFIMAANLIEEGKRKVERYWPETCSKYGDIMVTLVSEEVFVDYTIRTFKVHKSGAASKRVVKQYHFTAWPDHGVPAHPLSLIEMVELAKAHAPSSRAPLLLHCSAGVGRTGTIVLLESALEMARAEKRVDVMGLLYKLRQQRVNLVETLEQYEFVHEALLERLFGEPTRQPQDKLVLYFNRIRQEKPDCKHSDLELQYERLKKLSPTLPQEKCKFALTNENRLKNRSMEILPDDEGRPILGAGASSVYINAVYTSGFANRKTYIATQYPLIITVEDFWQLVYDSGSQTIVLLNDIDPKDEGYNKPKAYICTQGPVEKTVADFWRLVWQEEICKFIMAANLIEEGKRKVERYWPETCSKYGDIMVTLVSEEVFVDYTIRTFKVHKSGAASKRVVKQYHFTAWPDHGVPAHPLSLIEMVELAKAHAPSSRAPLLLHCSAGVGRTGTIVLLESALRDGKSGETGGRMGLLYKLRQQRVNLVETLPQDKLVLYFNRIRQEKPDCKHSDLELQYERLKKLSPTLPQEKCKFALTNENRLKNRSMEILPDDEGRPILGAGASSVYINAVYTSGFANRKTYIATQYPLIITVEDFWQLVYDSGSQTIVLLNDIDPKDESLPLFWPQTGSMHHRHLRIDHVSTDVATGGVLLRKFKLKNTAKSPKSRIVKQFHLQGWHKGDVAPPSVDLLLRLLAKVERWQRKCPGNPTIVSCFNGATASGLFCAASFLSDQLKAERQADVLMAARTVRQHRPTFIPNATQYRWLYEVAVALASSKQSKSR
ncbi:hypothetical protein ISCGN_030441 [Ixodes scapularis]